MRLKKIILGSLAITLAASPIITLTFINAFPKKDFIDKRYLINDSIAKKSQEELSLALDNTIGNKDLIFKFYTLTKTNQYTPSQLSWFVEFDKALNALDKRLGFELVPRTNQTVETGFRQRNGEMISMFWSPDYHNIGTWIGFHFYPDYQSTNLWPSLFTYLTSGKNGNIPDDASSLNFGPINSNFMPSKWALSLRNHLENSFYPIGENSPTNKLFQPNEDLIKLDKKMHVIDESKYSPIGSRVAISNEIALWADMNNDLAIGLINWMDHQNSSLPWIGNGPSTTLKLLVRDGYHTPRNDYSDITFRDWFYNPGKVNGEIFRWWNPTDPFATNKTPFNPSFNDSSNNMFFQSTYNGLVEWKIINDWEYEEIQGNWIPPKHSFFMSGASKIEFYKGTTKLPYFLEKNKLENSNLEIPINDSTYLSTLKQSDSIEFTISDNFPWLNSKGEDTNFDLMAQDYFWGLMGYYLSTEIKMNTNGYYLSLMNLDIQKTIDANPTFYERVDGKIRPKDSTTNKIKFILTKPNINFLDILSKQFFQPLPINNQKVKNIFEIPFNADLWDKEGDFQINKLDFNTLYGCGEDKKNYIDWWFAGPYYISNVNEQDIQFIKNDIYFDTITKKNTLPIFGNKPKINKIVMKYAGAYSSQLTYEQFKTGEIDKSDIPPALISDAYKNFKNDFKTEGVSLVPRTDIIPYNLNIYEVNEYLEPKLDNEGEKIIKSLVSPEYEEAIARDFHLGPKGNSWKIRNAINQSIDWYSLSSLALPDGNPSFQQSLIPYGNFRSIDGNLTSIPNFINKSTYWETAANNSKIGILRRTLDEYKRNWEKQFK